MKTSRNDPNKLTKFGRWKLLTSLTIGFFLLLVSIVCIIIDPLVLCVKYATRISKGSEMYDILTKELEGAFVETYLFNITNVEQFISGEDYKLKVEEVGPFTYQEIRKHDDMELDEAAGILRYRPRIWTRFLPERSIADPNDVNVSVPNIPLMAMASKMGDYPYLTQLGFNMLAARLDSQAINNLKIHDFLWGYDDPLIALGNKLMPGWINFEKLGLLDRLYDQKPEYLLELRSTNSEKFKVKSVNGHGGLEIWEYDDISKRTRCNTFVDTYEGIGFPPQLTPDTPLRLYRNVFCRILDLQFDGTIDLGFSPKAFRYRLSNESFSTGPETDCMCNRAGCIDGLTDLSPCFYGFSVALSQAHYIGSDPKLYERIEGIHPDSDMHGSEFVVDPTLGSVVRTRLTLQLNVVVKNANFNSRVKPFSNMIIPVLYFRIVQPELPDETKAIFRSLYFVYPYVVFGVQSFLFVVALLILAYAARLYCTWLYPGRAMGFQSISKPVPLYQEQALIDKDTNFSVEIIKKEQDNQYS